MAAAAAKIPAVIRRESPGRKKPTNKPVSTKTMEQMSAGPPVRISSFSPSGSKSEWKKWRRDWSTRSGSLSERPGWPILLSSRQSAGDPLRECLLPYGNRKCWGRRQLQSEEAAKWKHEGDGVREALSQGLGKPGLLKSGVAESSGGVFGEAQQLLYPWNGESGGSSAGFDGLVGFCEIVPGQRIHVGANDQVGVTLPGIELMFLCGADGARNHLEHVLGRVALAIVNANGNSDDDGAAELACGLRGNRRDEDAIGKAAGADLYWFEQARESATGANGFDQRAL